MTGLKMMLLTALGVILLINLKGTTASTADNYWPDGTSRWLQGYAQSVSGQTVSYHSALPNVNSALLVRAADEKSQIEWETESVPADWTDPFITFVWLAGMATHKGSHEFTVSSSRRHILTFTTAKDSSQKLFRFPGENEAELIFLPTKVEQFDELFGFMLLKLPQHFCQKGQPLRIRVTGEPAGSLDWYMTFRSAVAPRIDARGEQVLVNRRGGVYQLARVDIVHIGPPQRISIFSPAAPRAEKALTLGHQSVDLFCEPVAAEKTFPVEIMIEGRKIAAQEIKLKPVKMRKLYLLPHSHNDIGYSDPQRVVEKKHWEYYEQAIELANKTADYPSEARFKWNVEILWAVESYLAHASEAKRQEFIDAVRQGRIGLQALLCNPLTGLCHPEELYHLTEYARRLRSRYGLIIDSAMITDIPGSLWSIVPALAQCGVRYYSSGPNFIPFMPDWGDRIGSSLKTWGDKPFYWVSPSGREKILFWMTGKGYSWFHGLNLGQIGTAGSQPIYDYVNELEEKGYPYEMIQVRYTIGGDNGPPDPQLPDFVRKWNEQHASPKLVIATSGEMFAAFEKRYGNNLPSMRGDFTPYWEDGALSTARETALNRNSANTLLQAEALWSMRDPAGFPSEDFYQAWRQVVLFDEHTWGASNSVSEPDHPGVVEQWEYKRAFALKGQELSNRLLQEALKRRQCSGSVQAVDVFNTNSWTRTDLVILPTGWIIGGGRVEDEQGNPVPSQTLSTGEFAFLARDVPPLGGRRFFMRRGPGINTGFMEAIPTRLSNGLLTVGVDESTGDISVLKSNQLGVNFVDASGGHGLNGYFYVPGRDPRKAQRASRPSLTVVEKGPLVASLVIESDAPGCNKLVREVRLVKGMDGVDILDTMDKKKVREKESIHFGFPFLVPGGTIRADLGWGIIEPENGQVAGSCKDFLSVHNWVDISNSRYGLTWMTRDSALVEPGSMTDESLNEQGTRSWKQETAPGLTLYSYAANNYWHTNYKADQEGWITLRYSVRPHGQFNAAEAKRFGIEKSQPLMAAPAEAFAPPLGSLFEVRPEGVLVTSLRPSVDKKALLIRLYNASGSPQKAAVTWKSHKPSGVYLSSPFEERNEKVEGVFDLPAFGVITLRAEGIE